MSNIGGGRALRVCDHCGGVDDHPRHVLTGGDTGTYPAPTPAVLAKVAKAVPDADRDRLIEALLDTGSIELHLDCCRERGCPTGDCDRRAAGVEDLRGKALLTHLLNEEG